MVLVLTYHKVLEEGLKPQPEFYTISPTAFDAQLSILADRGFRFRALDEIAEDSSPPADACFLTFDDATLDHYEVAFPILERHGAQATFFVPTGRLNTPGYLTTLNVKEMVKAGHLIGSHSHRHVRLDRLSADDARDQLFRSRQLIGEITGIPPRVFAPVGGYTDRQLLAEARSAGFTLVRTMRWGLNRRLNRMRLECVPVNRHLSANQLAGIVAGRHARLLSWIYAGKQAVKSMVPEAIYDRLRHTVGAAIEKD
jgi:peptidoglycan/xylan/chitin deacetylase (PgdA/CDA1 family)